ncbi:hypothetical protein FN846DRAFT_940953 [Sphaerosporella brunnea]|uniref:Uncharacterized protein n=1 Tax=Sphaerosporella brunnea TaxID=1250544 RepID=A0A5J5F1X1_9PEZI|nr:hypothetical protein FN846DRAFT_940953 [Sphaerosporella brunnea]
MLELYIPMRAGIGSLSLSLLPTLFFSTSSVRFFFFFFFFVFLPLQDDVYTYFFSQWPTCCGDPFFFMFYGWLVGWLPGHL